MNQAALDRICSTVSVMSATEIRTVISLLRVTNKNSKTAELLFFLKDKKQISPEELAFYFFTPKHIRVKAATLLIERLEAKLFSYLPIDLNIDRKDSFSDAFRAKVKGRGWMSTMEIMHTRGETEVTLSLIARIGNLCVNYELYDLMKELLHYQLMNSSLWGRFKTRGEVEDDIEHYSFCSLALSRARQVYYSWGQLDEYKSNYLGVLEANVSEVQGLYKGSKS
ncbi:MAG: hypothetical protein GY861_01950, partial [bacterium]|nr:hypothetical protein [bacterium]